MQQALPHPLEPREAQSRAERDRPWLRVRKTGSGTVARSRRPLVAVTNPSRSVPRAATQVTARWSLNWFCPA